MVTLNKPRPVEAAQEVPAAKAANVQMNILVSPAFKRAVRLRAIDEGVSANALIERVVSAYLEANQ